VVTADGGGKFVFARLKKRQEFHSTCFPCFPYSHCGLGILYVFESIYRFLSIYSASKTIPKTNKENEINSLLFHA
jgi:hypothetical protein